MKESVTTKGSELHLLLEAKSAASKLIKILSKIQFSQANFDEDETVLTLQKIDDLFHLVVKEKFCICRADDKS